MGVLHATATRGGTALCCRLLLAFSISLIYLNGCGAFLPPRSWSPLPLQQHSAAPPPSPSSPSSPSALTIMQARKSGSSGFKPKRRSGGSGGSGKRKTSGGGGEEGGGQRWLGEDAETAPDGEEEVIQLNMPVEELIEFSDRLEQGFKALSKKHEDSQPLVILNATGLHWILSQVAYDTGIKMIGVAGLNQIREASRRLPDDIEWVLTGGINEKNVRRIPSVERLSLVYVSGTYGADLLHEALAREEKRLSRRQPLTKVSSSRLKFLKKRDGFKTPDDAEEGGEPLYNVTKDIVLSINETSTAEQVLSFANYLTRSCPKLNIWGVSVERNSERTDVVAPLRALLGPSLRVVLPGEEQEVLAKEVTRENGPWSALVTQLTVEAPVIEEEGGEGGEGGEEEEEEGEWGVEEGEGEGEEGEEEDYDPLTAEGYIIAGDEEGGEEEEGEEERGQSEEGKEALSSSSPPASGKQARKPRLVGRGSKGGSWSGQGVDDAADSGDGDDDGAAGSYGASFDRSSW